jgi:hypothetical protein
VGRYEQIAIELLESSFGDRWARDDTRIFSFGPDAGTGEVDGTIDGRIAVEVGVGSPKQVRASVLDLVLHPYPLKLLVLVDTPGHSAERSVRQSAAILSELRSAGVVIHLADRWHAGETERLLSRLFAEADEAGAVLIFSESDDLMSDSRA